MMNSKIMTHIPDHATGNIPLPCIDRKGSSHGSTLHTALTRLTISAPPPAEPGSRPSFLSPDTLSGRLQTFLSRNLGKRVTLKELSHFLGYSEKYSSEFFRLQMGICFSHYLKRLRVTNAAHMLGNHTLSIAQIAESLGFSDSFAFSHFFKRAMGCSPTAYRKHHVMNVELQ